MSFWVASCSGRRVQQNTLHFFAAHHTPSGRGNIQMYDAEVEFDANDEKVGCVLVILELRHPHPCDGRVVETNKLLAYLYAGNMNV